MENSPEKVGRSDSSGSLGFELIHLSLELTSLDLEIIESMLNAMLIGLVEVWVG